MGGKKLHHKQKAFTIIELLVVIAIIVILAALGIVAYSGYTSGAKKNVSKIIHSKTVRFLSAEITLCSLMEDSAIMDNRISCSFKKGGWNGCNSNDCKAQMIIDVLDVFKDKNPYESKKRAVISNESGLGYTVVYNQKDYLKIKTQWNEDKAISPLVNYIYFDGTSVSKTETPDPDEPTTPESDKPTTGRPGQTFETYKPPVIPGVFGEKCPRKPEAELNEYQKKNKFAAQEKLGCNFGAWMLVDSEGNPARPKLDYPCDDSDGKGPVWLNPKISDSNPLAQKFNWRGMNPNKPFCYGLVHQGTGWYDPELAGTRSPMFISNNREKMDEYMEKYDLRMVLVNPLTNYFGEEDTDGDGVANTDINDRIPYDFTRKNRITHRGVFSCKRKEGDSCKYNFKTKTWSNIEGENLHTDTGAYLHWRGDDKNKKKYKGAMLERDDPICIATRRIADDEPLTKENCAPYNF